MTSKFYKKATLLCLVLLVLVSLLFAPCAAQTSEEIEELFSYSTGTGTSITKMYDPMEKFNKKMFRVNRILFKQLGSSANKNLFKRTAGRNVSSGRKMIKRTLFNVVDNLSAPSYMINHLLQGHPEKSIREFWRFFINSTLGIFGIFDVAENIGLEKKPASYRETLAKYGIKNGPFIVLPILGATSMRNGFAALLEILTNPLSLVTQHYFISFVMYNCTQVAREIDYYPVVVEGSIDPYTRLRTFLANYDTI